MKNRNKTCIVSIAGTIALMVVVIFLLISCGSTGKTNNDEAISLDDAIKLSADDIIKKIPRSTKIALFNISQDQYSMITEFIITGISDILVDKASLDVLDRENMEIIDAEHKFQMSGRVSDDEIISIAAKSGASTVVSCSITGQGALRRLRVMALDVKTGKIQSSTAHRVTIDIDLVSQPSTPNNDRSVTETTNTQPVPVQFSINEDRWGVNTLPAGVTHHYPFQAGNYQSYFIEWRDSDFVHSYSYADIKVGVRRNDALIVPVTDNGNNALNKHKIITTPGNSYIIVVQGVESVSSGDYQIKYYPEIIYQIGAKGPAGGLVFYDKGNSSNGWRYLEAAPADTEIKNLRWGAYNYDVTGTQLDLGSGRQNTQLIINALRSINQSGTAAQICAQLNSGGVTDWFLPSRDELHWMFINLHNKGFGGFKNARYWTSSQTDKNRAWYLHFGDNGRASNNYDKDRDGFFKGEIWTRAIRAF